MRKLLPINRYISKHKTNQTLSLAAKMLTTCSEEWFAPAQSLLGVYYEHGYGVEKDEKESLKLYHIAAKQGVASAKRNLCASYINGTGVEKNMSTSAKWFNAANEQV